MSIPNFWAQPLRYLRYASHEHQAKFYAVLLGSAGFAVPVVVIPLRRALGYEDSKPVPMTWPRLSLHLHFLFLRRRLTMAVPDRKREPVPNEFDDPA